MTEPTTCKEWIEEAQRALNAPPPIDLETAQLFALECLDRAIEALPFAERNGGDFEHATNENGEFEYELVLHSGERVTVFAESEAAAKATQELPSTVDHVSPVKRWRAA